MGGYLWRGKKKARSKPAPEPLLRSTLEARFPVAARFTARALAPIL
jgi:hypothetical protein